MKNNLETFPSIRVVWNLTNSCPFNCPMCVASANTRRERNKKKKKILQSLLSVPKEKLTIDFSGGDPLFLPENIEIVKKASSILGKDKIDFACLAIYIIKNKNAILTGGVDNFNINIYHSKDYSLLLQIQNGHNDQIYCFIELKNGCFASCSADKTIRVWSI